MTTTLLSRDFVRLVAVAILVDGCPFGNPGACDRIADHGVACASCRMAEPGKKFEDGVGMATK